MANQNGVVADAVVDANAEFHGNANAVHDAEAAPNAGGTGSGRVKGKYSRMYCAV